MTLKNHGPGGCCCGGDCCDLWNDFGFPQFQVGFNRENEFHPLYPWTANDWVIAPLGSVGGDYTIKTKPGGSISPVLIFGNGTLGQCQTGLQWYGVSILRFDLKVSAFPANLGFFLGNYGGAIDPDRPGFRVDYQYGSNLMFHFASEESANVSFSRGGSTTFLNSPFDSQHAPMPIHTQTSPEFGMSGTGFYCMGEQKSVTPVGIDEPLSVELHLWGRFYTESSIATLYVGGIPIYQWMHDSKVTAQNDFRIGFYAGWNHLTEADVYGKGYIDYINSYVSNTDNPANEQVFADANPNCIYTISMGRTCWTATTDRVTDGAGVWCPHVDNCNEEMDKDIYGVTGSTLAESYQDNTDPFPVEIQTISITNAFGQTGETLNRSFAPTNNGPGYIQFQTGGTGNTLSEIDGFTIDGYNYKYELFTVRVVIQQGYAQIEASGGLVVNEEITPVPPPPTYGVKTIIKQEANGLDEPIARVISDSDPSYLHWIQTDLSNSLYDTDSLRDAIAGAGWTITINT